MEFIDLKTQYREIEEEVQLRINKVLEHGRYIMGPEILTLEQHLSDFVGIKHSVGVASGTDALLLALMALEIKPGDEVITTPFTFIATAEMIALIGAKPVFVDIDPETYNIDPNQLEAAITDKTKAIITVDLYGLCADYDAVSAVAKQHNVAVIEDAAQSFGATYKGRKACSLGDITCTSFFPSKPLGCYGDGGAVFTDNDVLAERIKQLRVHGQSKRYYHTSIGFNGRLDTLQAAILLAKLAIFPQEVQARHRIGERYIDLLKDHVVTPVQLPDYQSVYGQFTVRVKHRDQVQATLKEQGIPTAIHYPVCIHQQPAFEYLGYKPGDFPHAEKAAAEVMSLPMHPYLADEDIKKIALAVIATQD
ncbi:MAG: aminotransferase DegT [Legionellales bacterium]|nr:aminotransferase DegT [Legionellales bacterium]|tara:strand:- start:9368 stop:10459 length:1092 start_codon:yes stop_codon:yes gene_type:complete